MLPRRSTLIALVCLLFSGLLAAPAQAAPLPQTQLTIRFFQVTAEVAASPDARARGLMGRTSLPPSHGMLFVFETPAIQCFWMRNTPLALSIAFIAEDGRIVTLADMQPFSEQNHCSETAVRFALEMEQGWFSKRGIRTGDRVGGLK